MLAVSQIPPSSFFSFTRTTEPSARPFVLATVSRSATPRNDGVYGGDTAVGRIVQTVPSAANSRNNSTDGPAPRREQQKLVDGTQLSGSDILRALQSAAVKKKKKNKKPKELSFANDRTLDDDDDVNYSNVKPLCIKSVWAVKLDELEKRLQELSQIN